MAITTFQELKTAIQNFYAFGGEGAEITDRIEEFISLSESRFKREKKLRSLLFDGRTTTPTVAAQDYITLPSDFKSLRLAYVDASPIVTIDITSPQSVYDRAAGNNSGVPTMGYIEGTKLYLAPVPDSIYSIEISYLKNFTDLSNANPANDLLTNCPDLYLQEGLYQAALYDKDQAEMASHGAEVQRIIDEISSNATLERFGSGVLVQRGNYMV